MVELRSEWEFDTWHGDILAVREEVRFCWGAAGQLEEPGGCLFSEESFFLEREESFREAGYRRERERFERRGGCHGRLWEILESWSLSWGRETIFLELRGRLQREVVAFREAAEIFRGEGYEKKEKARGWLEWERVRFRWFFWEIAWREGCLREACRDSAGMRELWGGFLESEEQETVRGSGAFGCWLLEEPFGRKILSWVFTEDRATSHNSKHPAEEETFRFGYYGFHVRFHSSYFSYLMLCDF